MTRAVRLPRLALPRRDTTLPVGKATKGATLANGTAEREQRTSYHQLDMLRGVAAIMIVLYHLSYVSERVVAPSGYLAVDIFFALSGFVIAHSYDTRLAQSLTASRFVAMRVLRFWPLYMIGLGLGLMFELSLIATHNHFAQSLSIVMLMATAGTVFLPFPFQTRFDHLFPLNGVSWSLFFELVVNILYAFAFPLLGRRMLGVVLTVSAMALAVMVANHGSIDLGDKRAEIGAGLVRAIFSFTAGVLLYRSGFRRLALPTWLPIVVLVAALAAPVPPAFRPWYDLAFVLIVSPVLVAAGASRQPGPALTRIGATLGGLSYALYAVHRPLLSFAATARTRLALPPGLTAVAFVIVVLILSHLLHRHVDTPLRRWLARRLGLAGVPRPKEVSAP